MATTRPIVSRILSRLRGRTPRVSRLPGVTVLQPDEAWALYDRAAREHLGMPADEFECRWERGEFRGRQEEAGVRRVLMLRTRRPS